MVEGVVGLMGTGKTAYTTKRALKARKEGVRVVANYRIEGCEKCDSWDEALAAIYGHYADRYEAQQRGESRGALPRLLLIIDELNLWAASRNWQEFDPRLLVAFAQGRKMGFDMIWTSQHEARVDTVVREITWWVWKARRFGPEGHPLMFQYAAYFPDEIRKERRKCQSRAFWWPLFQRGILKSYDTCELVDIQSKKYSTYTGEIYREANRLPVVSEGVRIEVAGGKKGLLRRRQSVRVKT